MYITTIYSNLSSKQKKKIISFLKNNYELSDTYCFEFEPLTIIILDLLENEIIGCICLFDNKNLLNKLKKNNINLNYYVISNLEEGFFIYNFCVDKNNRKKKIGTNLLKYTIQKMIELNIKYLHTHAENNISKILFLKNGFFENDTFISPIKNEKIYIMIKYL